MSILNGTSHVSTREFTIRTGSDGYEQSDRILTPDPAAVANLKRILAQQAATGRSQAQPRRPKPAPKARGGQKDHVAAILEKAKEKKRPSTNLVEPDKPMIEDEMKPKSKRVIVAETFTEAVCRELHEKYYVGEGKTVQWIAKNNEYLPTTTTTMTRLFREYKLPYATKSDKWALGIGEAEATAEPPRAAKTPPAAAVGAVEPMETAVTLTSPPNGRAVADTASTDASPPIAEQLANLRQLLAALPRGKDIKIHGKISIELEF